MAYQLDRYFPNDISIISIFPKKHINYTDITDKTDTDTHIGIIDKWYPSLGLLYKVRNSTMVLSRHQLLNFCERATSQNVVLRLSYSECVPRSLNAYSTQKSVPYADNWWHFVTRYASLWHIFSNAYQGALLKRVPNSVTYYTEPRQISWNSKIPRIFDHLAVVYPILPTDLLFHLLFLPLSIAKIKGILWGTGAKALGSPRDALFA
jgi:hypothetical protein